MDSGRFIDRQFTLLITGKIPRFIISVFIGYGCCGTRLELEHIELIRKGLRHHVKACLHAGVGMRSGDFNRLTLCRIILSHQQEIRGRGIADIAVIADIRVETSLLIIHGDSGRVA